MVSGRLVTSQQTFVRDAGRSVRHTCDLHWRVSNRAAFACLLPWESLPPRMPARLPLSTRSADGLAPPHALLMACLHRVAHHFDAPSLIWLYDVHLLVSSMSEDEAARFVRLAVDSGLAAVCARGVALAQHHFHTPLPAALERLAPAGDEPLAAYYATRGFGPFDVLMSDLRALRGVSRPLPVVARTHLPPPSRYLRAARPRLGSGPLALLYSAPDHFGAPRAESRQRRGQSGTNKDRLIAMSLNPDSDHGALRFGLGPLRPADARARASAAAPFAFAQPGRACTPRFGTERS